MDLSQAVIKHRDGATLNLFVTTKANSSIFPAGYNIWRKRIEIKVCAEAKENMANKELIKTIAEYFSILTKDISIVSGEKNREKTILVKDVYVEDIIKKIRKSLDGL